MISVQNQKLLKGTAIGVAVLVTAGCFLAIPRIAEALPASLMALLTLSPVREPIAALRPEPQPHESLLWEEPSEESPPPKEESGEEEPDFSADERFEIIKSTHYGKKTFVNILLYRGGEIA